MDRTCRICSGHGIYYNYVHGEQVDLTCYQCGGSGSSSVDLGLEKSKQLELKFMKLNHKAIVPSYANPGDAGLDFIALNYEFDWDGAADTLPKSINYGTGIAVEIPEGYVGLIFPRSSQSLMDLTLGNCVGVIDSGYRGEIKFRFKPDAPAVIRKKHITDFLMYEVGDKIGQLVVVPIPAIKVSVVTELSPSTRGNGSYGSSGR